MSVVDALGEAAVVGLEEGAGFLMKHPDIIRVVNIALESGASKEVVLAAIRATMIATAEEMLEDEIGPRP